jgi:hypothetical protein
MINVGLAGDQCLVPLAQEGRNQLNRGSGTKSMLEIVIEVSGYIDNIGRACLIIIPFHDLVVQAN